MRALIVYVNLSRACFQGVFRFFLTGALILNENGPANPGAGWLPDKSWNDLQVLDQQPGFEGFAGARIY